MQQTYSGVKPVGADEKATTQPGLGVFANCTVAGNLALLMADGSTLSWPVATGANRLDGFRCKGWKASGSTATATVYLLYP